MSTIINGTSNAITFPDGTIQTTAAVSSAFASGTALLFYQASAPTGWTKSTSNDNKALRVVSGTGGGSGGSVAFTTAFASQSVSGSVGSYTLSTSEIPSHTHSAGCETYGASAQYAQTNNNLTRTTNTGSTGGGGSHSHSFSGTAINLAVQYIDVIVCTKD